MQNSRDVTLVSGAKRTIINLNSKHVDSATCSVLSKGLNFAVTPAMVPYKDIVCGVAAVIVDGVSCSAPLA